MNIATGANRLGKKTRSLKELLDELLRIANSDTGQARIVANVLLSWWNAQECGGFNPTELWGLDDEIARNVLLLIAGISSLRSYPDTLGYSTAFEALIERWRPHLLEKRG